jgi:hypothetical protein
MVGHQDEGAVAEVDRRHIGAEGLKTPPQESPRRRQPGGHVLIGVGRSDVEKAQLHPRS